MQPGARELIVRDLEGNAITVPLDRERIGLGRSAANELCYPDDHGLSRQHLVLIRTQEDWRVEDLGSKNGTLLNGQCLDRRLDSQGLIASEVAAWEARRNAQQARIHWTFTLAAARRKLRKLYPPIEG